jgi:hypothetical protein
MNTFNINDFITYKKEFVNKYNFDNDTYKVLCITKSIIYLVHIKTNTRTQKYWGNEKVCLFELDKTYYRKEKLKQLRS